jgi:hypothetical protein
MRSGAAAALTALCAITLMAVRGGRSQTQALEPLVYTITVPEPTSKTFTVDVVVPTDGRSSVDLMMPVWSPGFYGLQWTGSMTSLDASSDRHPNHYTARTRKASRSFQP